MLVCLDTVRADAVEARGDAPPAMPALAAFCGEHTRFVDASAPASWTMPCVTSLLTGLSPEHHGVHGNGNAVGAVGSIAMLAEYLKERGYVTTALTGGGWILEQFGFAQGFDAFARYDALTFEDGGERLDRFVRTVDRTRPWFLFVHSYEAHDPYGVKRPPAGADDPATVARVHAYVDTFRKGVQDPQSGDVPEGVDPVDLLVRWRSEPITFFALSSPRVGRDVVERVVFRWADTKFATDPHRAEIERTLRTRYEDGLRRVDAGFARLMEHLAPISAPESTVVIVTSDHGEAFGEHGVLGHGRYLADVLTRVLIAISAPGRVPTGGVHGGCSLIDVVPTVLELVGLPAAEGLDGASLLPLSKGASHGHPVFAEEYRDHWKDGRAVPRRVASVRGTRAKFVATLDVETGAVTEEVFDLVRDPAEDHPLSAQEAAKFDELDASSLDRVRARVAALAKQTGTK